MARTLKIHIHGVVAFVRKDKQGTAYRIIVPDTLLCEPRPGRRKHKMKKRPRAADSSPLVRHDPWLVIGHGGLTLRGHRIEFGNLPEGTTGVVRDSTVDGLPQMGEVGGSECCKIHGDYLGSAPAGTAAILDIDQGTLKAVDDAEAELLALPDVTGNKKPGKKQKIEYHHLVWEVDGLTGAQVDVRATPLGGGDATELSVPVPGSGDLEGWLANVRADADEAADAGADDPDFRWYYQMLAARDDVRDYYRHNPLLTLPYPRRTRGGSAHVVPPMDIQTQNCRPCEFCPGP